MRKFYFLVLLFILPSAAFAQFEINAGGNWTDPSIWAGGVSASTATDNVTQDDGFSVTVQGTDNITSGSLTTGFTNTLVVSGPSGSLTLGNSTTPANLTALGNDFSMTIQAGATLIIWGDLDVQTYLSLTIQPGGTLIVKGNVNMQNNAVLAVNGNMEVDGNFTGGFYTHVTVFGTISVFGVTSVGDHSSEDGTGLFHTYGGCFEGTSSTFCDQPAPVTLLFFKAEAKTSSVTLDWATASEINFDYFLVEKSPDGIHFSEMTTVGARGSVKGRTDYSVEDEKPMEGRNYYRLTEVDLDRKVTPLLVVNANFTGEKTFSIYPNPGASEQVNFELNFTPEADVLLSVVDLRGATVAEFFVNQSSVKLPLHLNPGLYLVTLRSGTFSKVGKMIIR